MTKDKLLKEFKELQEAYDGVWHMKERYKDKYNKIWDKWEKAEAKLDFIYKELEQFMEGIKE